MKEARNPLPPRIRSVKVNWFCDGAAATDKSEQISHLVRTKSMDKIFEYYCLLKLEEMFKSHGYALDGAPQRYDYSSRIGVKTGKNKTALVKISDKYEEETEIYNVFKYKYQDNTLDNDNKTAVPPSAEAEDSGTKDSHEGESVVLYYRPYIPTPGFTLENGLELHRMTTFSRRQAKEMDEGANNRKANKGTASNNNIYQHQGPDTNKPDTAGDAYRFYDAAPGKMPFSFGVLPFTPEYFEEAGNMNSPIGILWKEISARVPWLREQPDTASTES